MSTENRTSKILRRIPRPLVAAALGAILSILCSLVDAPGPREVCKTIAHVIPAACETSER